MDNPLAQRVLSHLNEQQDTMVNFLQQLVRAESPSTVPEAQAGVQQLLSQELHELDYQVDMVGGQGSGGHLLATYNGAEQGEPQQLLLGHSDTVWPIGTLEQMPLVLENNRLRGPGVYDMKAGLTQMIFALRALHALDLRPPVAPVVFVNSDEEIGSDESTPYIVDLAQQVERVFVVEPSLEPGGRLKTARKGVGRFEVVANGVAAHAGLNPEKGRSAILEISHVIQKLFALNDHARGVTVNVGVVSGGMRRNVVAPTAQVQVDVRVPTQADAEAVTRAIYALQPEVPDVTLEIRGAVNRRPLELTPRNQALWQLAQQCGAQLGVDLEAGSAGGGSDGNTTSQYTATLDGLGAVGDGAHATHEFVYVDKMPERAALLALLLLAPPLARPNGDA